MVIDASVAVAWYIDDKNPAAKAILAALDAEKMYVPANFGTEVVNALLKAERRGICSETQVSRAIEHMRGLPLEAEAPSLAVVAALGRRHQLTGYDAAYLALAKETGSHVATLDSKLAAAAKAEKLLWVAPKGAHSK